MNFVYTLLYLLVIFKLGLDVSLLGEDKRNWCSLLRIDLTGTVYTNYEDFG